MIDKFEQKISDFFDAVFPNGFSGRFLLAVSGGPDSMAMVYALSSLKQAGSLDCEFLCVHINHCLRAESSDEDEKFVIEHAEKLSIEVITKKVDVAARAVADKISVETAARNVRIDAFIRIASQNNCCGVVTGHNKDDNAETVLQRMARGTAFRGICGIWPQKMIRGLDFYRPLLCVTRAEIEDYLKRRKLACRIDQTNTDRAYRRNFIRHELIPYFRDQGFEDMSSRISELSEKTRKLQSMIEQKALDCWAGLAVIDGAACSIDAAGFNDLAEPVRIEAIRLALKHIGCGESDVTQRHYEKILHAASENKSGQCCELSGGFAVSRRYGKLVFEKQQAEPQPFAEFKFNAEGGREADGLYIETEILDPADIDIDSFRKTKDEFTEWFDLDRLKAPFFIRPRRDADKFRPLGLSGDKRIGKFLTDSKVTPAMKQNVLVVTDTEKIIWLWPLRISGQSRVTAGTKKILQMKIRTV